MTSPRLLVCLNTFIFVHDRIYNSVADYYSSRVGVGCMYVGSMLDVPIQFSQWDSISMFLARGLKLFAGPCYKNLLYK